MKRFHACLLLICFFSSEFSFAQPNYSSPSGVWCSCPPTTGVGSGSVMPAVASKSYVNGILVRVVWKDVETTDNTYNWSLIDGQIAAAQSYGKKISLAVGGGPNSPSWLYSAGASSIDYSLPFSGTIPVPWDSVFLSQWTDFISELGARYQNDTTIQLVYITTSSANGFEMQLPFSPTPSYATLGYNDQLVIDSWKEIMDEFNSAFPNHYLSNDFHPVNSSDAVADSVYAYAMEIYGNRYGANAWWWTQNNTTVYPAQYAILQNSANSNSFTGLQMAASGISNPSSFGAGGMPEALALAIEKNVCYWEVWNNDITDGSFDSLLSTATCSSLGTTNTELENYLSIFPNPSNGSFTINYDGKLIEEIVVMNELGQEMYRENDIKKNTVDLNLEKLSAGIYQVITKDDLGRMIYKKIAVSH